jgi:hypothetical protein
VLGAVAQPPLAVAFDDRFIYSSHSRSNMTAMNRRRQTRSDGAWDYAYA